MSFDRLSNSSNPFIAKLPDLMEPDQAIRAMSRMVTATPEERALGYLQRAVLVDNIKRFMQPLARNVILFNHISLLIRKGYESRNPLYRPYARQLDAHTDKLRTALRNDNGWISTSGSSPALIGLTGVGKSTAVEAVLGCYPRVIDHRDLSGDIKDVLQLVWLKLTCPQDGSIKGLCLDFFHQVDQALGTPYHQLYAKSGSSLDRLRVDMARVAHIHGLGLLVIDDIQHLADAKSANAMQMLNFFKLLADVMGFPILPVGTDRALGLLGQDMQNARRMTGLPRFDRLLPDDEFAFLSESLFEAQYLRSPIPLTDDLLATLYNLSQGIPDILVKLFIRAQAHALDLGIEELSEDLFHTVYDEYFGPLHDHLERMRRGARPYEAPFSSALASTRVSGDEAAHPSIGSDPSAKSREYPGTQSSPLDLAEELKSPPVKRIKSGAKKRQPSKCGLVEAVREGKLAGTSAHDTLTSTGIIRRLGDEALRL